MKLELNLKSQRSQAARFRRHFGQIGYDLVGGLGLALVLFGFYLFLGGGSHASAYWAWTLASPLLTLALWYSRALKKLPPRLPASGLDDVLDAGLLASLKAPLTPAGLGQAALKQWQGIFMLNHLFIDPKVIAPLLAQDEAGVPAVWQTAQALAADDQAAWQAGTLMAALLLSTPAALEYLAKQNLKPDDIKQVLDWLDRLIAYHDQPDAFFGGLGRDWASGFTPLLDRFGQNFSRVIEAGRGHYHFLAHADTLDPLVHNLSEGGGVAIVGEAGVGKTSLAYALAQRLLSGHDANLRYYQVVSLSASEIIAGAGQSLEKLVLSLLGEAVQAGNIIIFLDDAELFFETKVGAFDMAGVLLPILQNHQLKIVAAMTPRDYQKLKSANAALATLLSAVTVNEPPPEDSFKMLQDSALSVEARNGLLVTHSAVKEAFRLSDQYMQDLAYPGKAIRLLDQAAAYADDKVLSAQSVQAALEKSLGVKVARVQAAEADTLLNLEERLHQRMINQVKAVKLVAAALRRGRAGVADPKRPNGSFLFLGPTGVGKTELARSRAAIYFGDERNMIRLDMTEYQQAADQARILDPGTDSANSLIASIRRQPFSVVLLDEVEKAHPNILNLLLQLLDEGQLTDSSGKPASFKEAIIIATSNAGALDIAQRVAGGSDLEGFERPLIEKLMQAGIFRPELINRFDEIALFRPLTQAELGQVAQIMLKSVNKTLAAQNISVELTPAALAAIVKAGYDPQFGARPMRRVIQATVQDAVAHKILSGEAQPGAQLNLDVADLKLSAQV